MQAAVRERIPVFHWMVEFPEVFYAERPDPLEGDHVNRAAMMDAFFGNPPFAGKNAIVDSNGPEYASWLRALDDGAHGSADLCAQFFRRADCLLGDHGTVGLVATNTIAQGDTRAAALEWLVNHGSVVYEATRSMVWPGAAAVAVAIVHLAKGTPARNIEARLEGQPVDGITSRLTPGIERPNPVRLQGNSGLSFLGLNPWGSGFFLGRDEARSLLESDPANGACVRPFIGGEEVNTDPRQEFSRYAIYFAAMDLAEAGRWPKLLRIVKERVKPARDALGDNTDARRMKAFWWQYYGRDRPEMSSAIGGLERCLVTSCVTKHLCFSFQPTGRLFDKSLYLFPLPSHTHFAILQARVHECWVRHLSSSMRNDLRYAASDCFETFPFPAPNPRELRHALEDVGRHVYDLRAQYMADENVGLTVTYNRLKDPACTDARILELRRLHEEMDRKVLDAYAENDPEGRWGEVEVPPFCPMGDGDRKKVERFEGEVIDRLFVLNAKRAEEEKRTGASTTKASKTTTSGKSKKATERSVPEQLALGETATSGGTTRTQSEKRTPRGETP
jgi:hypothetical protein